MTKRPGTISDNGFITPGILDFADLIFQANRQKIQFIKQEICNNQVDRGDWLCPRAYLSKWINGIIFKTAHKIFFSLFFFILIYFSKYKTVVRSVPGLLVIQIQIQAVWQQTESRTCGTFTCTQIHLQEVHVLDLV